MAPRIGIRQRKLNQRIGLEVIRERELEVLESDAQATPAVETGVEKHEETEHHLQVAIASQAAGRAAQVYIPTPEAVSSSVPYKQLYQTRFKQPSTLIRFSSTVEDCCGVAYNITDEDDVFLKELNEKLAQKKSPLGSCSEDQFEMVMNFFEETTKAQQPFSNVGEPPPILTFDELESAYDESIDENARSFAKDIYEHWKSLRTKASNTAIQPGLKLKIMDSATDADDSDPYVCFRRREVRQVRKTRGRDAQSVEKLRKLRLELDTARNLVQLVKARESIKREFLEIEQKLFNQRTELRKLKRGLPDPYKDGDEDILVNQRPVKRRPLVEINTQRQSLSQARPSVQRPDGRTSTEQELVHIDDILHRKEQQIQNEIIVKKHQHLKWNTGYVDWTNNPLTPPASATENTGFRVAKIEYLPTPPASDVEMDQQESKEPQVNIRYSDIKPDVPTERHQSFRRRTGRGGRTWIDRRSIPVRTKTEMDATAVDAFKFDDDDDDDDVKDCGQYYFDPFDLNSMRYRAAVCASTPAHTNTRTTRPAIEPAPSTSGNSQTAAAAAGSSQSGAVNG